MLERLRDLIFVQERQMLATLEGARAAFDHGGDRGDHAEDAVRDFMRRYLPRSFDVGHGEIVDSHGGRSSQTDVVITGPEHPPTFERDKPGLFFIEGVRAAGEVKSRLTADHLTATLRSAARFKRLKPETQGNLAVGLRADLDRFARGGPAFLVAFESALTLDTVITRTVAAAHDEADPNGPLDGIFLLDKGCAMDIGDGSGALRGIDESGHPVTGWLTDSSDAVLFSFVAWLSAVMPTLSVGEPVLRRYLLPSAPG